MYLYDQLALAKSELGRLNEENKQLKDFVSRLTLKYNAFQMQMPVYTTLLLQQQRTNNHRALLRGAPGHEVNSIVNNVRTYQILERTDVVDPCMHPSSS